MAAERDAVDEPARVSDLAEHQVDHAALATGLVADVGHHLLEVDLLQRRQGLLGIFLQLELGLGEQGRRIVLLVGGFELGDRGLAVFGGLDLAQDARDSARLPGLAEGEHDEAGREQRDHGGDADQDRLRRLRDHERRDQAAQHPDREQRDTETQQELPDLILAEGVGNGLPLEPGGFVEARLVRALFLFERALELPRFLRHGTPIARPPGPLNPQRTRYYDLRPWAAAGCRAACPAWPRSGSAGRCSARATVLERPTTRPRARSSALR